MKTKTLALLALFFITSAPLCLSAAPTKPCRELVEDASFARIGIDSTLKIIAGPKVANQIFSIAETFYDLSLDLTGIDRSLVATLLAKGAVNEDSAKAILESAGDTTSLLPLLPSNVARKIGTRDTASCYEAAFPFNDPAYRHNSNFMPYFRSHYYPLGFQQESLRYGDLVVLWRKHPNGPFFTQHVAIYLGGDFLYHKFGPHPQAAYEFITFKSFLGYYVYAQGEAVRQARLARRQPDPGFTEDFHFEYMRFDPKISEDPVKVQAVKASIQRHSGKP